MLAQVFYWGKLGVDIAENGKDSLCHGRVQASAKQFVGGEDKNKEEETMWDGWSALRNNGALARV